MNDISVPNTPQLESTEVKLALSNELAQLTPQVRKAASYVLENPNDVSVSSIREIAQAADVKPNTLVRMARSVGLDGYEDFREPFREEIRRGMVNFPDGARWLQSLGQSGKLGHLYKGMVGSAIQNIEDTFSDIVGSDHRFVVSTETPQFFPSSVSTIALLETLLSFAITMAKPKIVVRVKTFHDRRNQLGLYYKENQ